MTLKTSSRWWQILFSWGYGSVMGLGFGLLFAIVLLGGVAVLSQIILYSGFIPEP